MTVSSTARRDAGGDGAVGEAEAAAMAGLVAQSAIDQGSGDNVSVRSRPNLSGCS